MKRYIKSDSGFGKDFNVFMLMGYWADTGPDTAGMGGDEFNCYGKFFAKDLATAKNELKSLEAKYPWINDSQYNGTQVYVDNYSEYFDSATREEQDEYSNPYDVDNNVFQNLETLIEYLGWDKAPYSGDFDVDASTNVTAARGRDRGKTYSTIKFSGWTASKEKLIEHLKGFSGPNATKRSTDELKRYVRYSLSEAENVKNKMEEYIDILSKFNSSSATQADMDKLLDELNNFKFSQNP